jgi:hypothetical protein
VAHFKKQIFAQIRRQHLLSEFLPLYGTVSVAAPPVNLKVWLPSPLFLGMVALF